MNDQVRVIFPLEQDEDGWPPYREEVAWADRTESADEVLLANILSFAPWISLGDRIRVRPRNDGRYDYIGLVQQSGHSTIRIRTEPETLLDIGGRLTSFGCQFEVCGPGFLGVDVPPEADWWSITKWLQTEQTADRLDYEEGAISVQHRAARRWMSDQEASQRAAP
jgi:Domain of unknown function (DUF4265)